MGLVCLFVRQMTDWSIWLYMSNVYCHAYIYINKILAAVQILYITILPTGKSELSSFQTYESTYSRYTLVINYCSLLCEKKRKQKDLHKSDFKATLLSNL